MIRRLSFLLLSFIPVVAMAATPGTAKGKITFNGKSKDLVCAYAWKEPDHFKKSQFNTVVFLSTTKLDDKTLADRSALIDLARKDKFTAVRVNIDANGEVGSGTFYTAAEDGYFDASGMHVWEKKSQSPSKIDGKLSVAERQFFKTRYSYSATFEAPISPAPKK